jgi:hypothetical protein
MMPLGNRHDDFAQKIIVRDFGHVNRFCRSTLVCMGTTPRVIVHDDTPTLYPQLIALVGGNVYLTSDFRTMMHVDESKCALSVVLRLRGKVRIIKGKGTTHMLKRILLQLKLL